MQLFDVYNRNGVVIARTSGSTPRHALADILGGGGTPDALKRNRQSIIRDADEYNDLGTATYAGCVAVPVSDGDDFRARVVDASADVACRREDLRIAAKHRYEAETRTMTPINRNAYMDALRWEQECLDRLNNALARLNYLAPLWTRDAKGETA